MKQGREKQSIRTCAHPCYRPKEEGGRSGSRENKEGKKGKIGSGGPMRSYAPVLRGNEILIFGFNFRIDLGAQTGS